LDHLSIDMRECVLVGVIVYAANYCGETDYNNLKSICHLREKWREREEEISID